MPNAEFRIMVLSFKNVRKEHTFIEHLALSIQH